MPQSQILDDSVIRELANTELNLVMHTCMMLLDERQTLLYLNYIITGAIALKEGYTAADKPDTNGAA